MGDSMPRKDLAFCANQDLTFNIAVLRIVRSNLLNKILNFLGFGRNDFHLEVLNCSNR